MSERAVIIGHGTSGYGLCFGYTSESNDEILARRSLTLQRARHIAYYESGKGGLTTLAVQGPSKESRIGKAVETLGLAEVLTILSVSEGAAKLIEQF